MSDNLSQTVKNCNNCGHRTPNVFEDKEPCNHCFQYEYWIPRDNSSTSKDSVRSSVNQTEEVR